MVALERWKNSLRVRYVGGGANSVADLKAGTEGIVCEFFGPRGNDYWQVAFPDLGTLNVHRTALEVTDPEFAREYSRQTEAQSDAIVRSAKEAVLYVTRKKMFKSLVVWHRDGHHDAINERGEADRILQLLKAHKVPLAQEIWYN